MKTSTVFFALIWWSLSLIGRVAAEDFPREFLEVGSCGLNCLINSLPVSGCDYEDIQCQCHSQALEEATWECMLDPCSVQDKIEMGRARDTVCNMPNDLTRVPKLVVTTAALLGVSVILGTIKIAGRLIYDRRLYLEEYLVLAAEGMVIAGGSIIFWLVENGYGRHTYYLNPPQISRLFLRYYAVETVYLLGMLFAKVAILYLYLQLFPGRWTRLATQCTLGLVMCSSIAIIIVQLNQCNPIPKAWNKDLAGTCLELNEIVLAAAGINIAQDSLILIIPMPVLANLTIPLRQKVSMIVIFGLYAFALVTSVVRLQFVRNLGRYLIDPAYDDAPATMWSVIEIHVSVVCACLPALPGSIRRIMTCTHRPPAASGYTHSHISLRSSSPQHDGGKLPIQPKIEIPDDSATVHGECTEVKGDFSTYDKDPESATSQNPSQNPRWSQTTYTASTWAPTTPTKRSHGISEIPPFSVNTTEPIKWEDAAARTSKESAEKKRRNGSGDKTDWSVSRTSPIKWDAEDEVEEVDWQQQRRREAGIGMAYSPDREEPEPSWFRIDEDSTDGKSDNMIGVAS